MIFKKAKTNQKLEQILLNFIDVLRINMLIADAKGHPVLVPKTQAYGFQGSAQWGALQNLGTPEFLSKFQTEAGYLKFVDLFGFQTFAIPIPIGDTDDIGYLVIGPVVLNKQFEQSLYQKAAEEAGVNYADFLGSLSEVRVVSYNTLKSILDLLSDLSRYALRLKETD